MHLCDKTDAYDTSERQAGVPIRRIDERKQQARSGTATEFDHQRTSETPADTDGATAPSEEIPY